MKFFGGELFALFTPMFSYILQKDDPESKIILQNRGTKHGLSTVYTNYMLIISFEATQFDRAIYFFITLASIFVDMSY